MKTFQQFNLELQERVQMVKGGVVGAKLSLSKLRKAYKHLNKVGADFRFGVSDDFIRQNPCLLYTSPSPRDLVISRMPSSA